MSNARCSNCGFLNFSSASACKRCRATLDAPTEAAHQYFGGYETNLQPAYQTAGEWALAPFQPAHLPSPVAPLPHVSKQSGTNIMLWALLGVVLVVAFGIGFAWKFWKPASASAPLVWQEYRSKDEVYSVLMPAQPVESVREMPSEAGMLQLHQAVGHMNGDGIYVVAHTDYPEEFMQVSPEVFLNSAAEGAIMMSGVTESVRKSITLDGHPGLEIEMVVPREKVPGGGRAVCRVYWAAPRLYMQFVGGRESSEIFKTRAKFLDSFKLLKPDLKTKAIKSVVESKRHPVF